MNTTMLLERAVSKRSLERVRPNLAQPARSTYER